MQVDNRLCGLGRFGQKSGMGYYRYAPGSREAQPDAEVSTVYVLQITDIADILKKLLFKIAGHVRPFLLSFLSFIASLYVCRIVRANTMASAAKMSNLARSG